MSIEQRLDRIDEKLDTNTDQIARLTEVLFGGLAEFRADMAELKASQERLSDKLDRLADIVQAQADVAKQQAAVAQQQVETVARLARIVEQVLVDRAGPAS